MYRRHEGVEDPVRISPVHVAKGDREADTSEAGKTGSGAGAAARVSLVQVARGAW